MCNEISSHTRACVKDVTKWRYVSIDPCFFCELRSERPMNTRPWMNLVFARLYQWYWKQSLFQDGTLTRDHLPFTITSWFFARNPLCNALDFRLDLSLSNARYRDQLTVHQRDWRGAWYVLSHAHYETLHNVLYTAYLVLALYTRYYRMMCARALDK